MSSPASNSKPTLLITGASSGLGLSLALHALRNGHRVLGTSRSISSSAAKNPEFASLGGIWLELDVTDASTTTTVTNIMSKHDISVVVNSAGYAAIGALESFSDAEVQAQFETNVFGVIRVIRGALPYLRERGERIRRQRQEGKKVGEGDEIESKELKLGEAGTIVNLSSGAGIWGVPARSLYSGSKFALEGISQSLEGEVAGFGVRVLLVELGAFRTGFGAGLVFPSSEKESQDRREGVDGSERESVEKAYEGSEVGKMVEFHRRLGKEVKEGKTVELVKGDPGKAAERILEAMMGIGLGGQVEGLRLVLGKDCLGRVEQVAEHWRGVVEGNREVAGGTEVGE